MKILHTVPFFAPHFGGVSERCYQLSKVLAQRGHQVTICTSDYQFNQAWADSIPAVEVRTFKGYLGRFCVCPGIRTFLDKKLHEFDVCHLMNHYSYINVVAGAQCRHRGVPYLFSAMGALLIMRRSFLAKRIFNRVFGIKLLKNANTLVAITELEVEQYLAYHQSIDQQKITTIPNAIYDQYDSNVSPDLFYEKFDIPRDHKIILFVGRLDPIKGPDILLRAFAARIADLPKTTLAFVGPDFGALEQVKNMPEVEIIRERVRFCGPLFNADKDNAYAAAHVLVVPSRHENMSIVALEAASWKVPVIISNTAGFEEIESSGAGVVVSPTPDEISQALVRIVSDSQVRDRMAEKARALVLTKYLWEHVGQHMEACLQDSIE